jgi:hypothetical protein
VLTLFVVHRAFDLGEKWSWLALLASGLITWGSLIGYKAVIGYYNLTASSITSIIGAVLVSAGIALSARQMLGKESG